MKFVQAAFAARKIVCVNHLSTPHEHRKVLQHDGVKEMKNARETCKFLVGFISTGSSPASKHHPWRRRRTTDPFEHEKNM